MGENAEEVVGGGKLYDKKLIKRDSNRKVYLIITKG